MNDNTNTLDEVDIDDIDYNRDAKTFKDILGDTVKPLPANAFVINGFGHISDIPTFVKHEMNDGVIDDEVADEFRILLCRQCDPAFAQEMIDYYDLDNYADD